MEKLKIEEVLSINNQIDLYNFLVDKTYDLVMNINVYKKFPYKVHEKKINTLKSISYDFGHSTIMFDDIDIVLGNLVNEVEFEVEIIIKYYNRAVDAYNKYIEIYKEIDENGFDTLDVDIRNKLTNLFRDMLIYKNKKYEDTDDFDRLISRVRLCYFDFSYLLDDIRTVVKSGTVFMPKTKSILRLDSIEYLNLLRKGCNTLSSQYKFYEAINEDIDLKDGETLEDLVSDIDYKLNQLYKSILDNDLENNEDEFIKRYPEYSEDIYRIREIEDDYQLMYYYKNDLYKSIIKKFK